MIKINDIAFTSYPVADKAKAQAFYEGILQLKPTMDMDLENGFWLEYEIGSGTLALSNMWPAANKAGPCVAFEVEDFAAAIQTLKDKGVSFDSEPFETPVCHIGIITDPDGNLITIHKRKAEHPLGT